MISSEDFECLFTSKQGTTEFNQSLETRRFNRICRVENKDVFLSNHSVRVITRNFDHSKRNEDSHIFVDISVHHHIR